MAKHTIDLPCTADTYINSYVKTKNYGLDTYVNCGQDVLTFPTPGIHPRFAMMKFALSGIPQYKRILKLSLRVYAIQDIQGPDAVFQIIKDTENNAFYASWLEGDASWDSVNPPDTIEDFIEIEYGKAAFLKERYHEFELPISLLQSTRFINYGLWFRWKSENKPNDNTTMLFSSREGANQPTLRVIYEDVPPDAPTPTEPIGIYRDLDKVIKFQWNYKSAVGGAQKKYDLQWSTDQQTWTTVTETTANTYYDMPAETVPPGNVYWRVRCYNSYDEYSDYSTTQVFYAVGAPDMPRITSATNAARPVVQWSTFGQQFYRLQILDGEQVIYDTNEVPSQTDREHKIKAFLNDGSYNIRLRIRNEFGLYSDWSELNHTITTVKPDAPPFSLQKSIYGLELNITGLSSYGLVYRAEKDNYICIAKVSNGRYKDNTVTNIEYKYFVRSVAETEAFADSEIKLAKPDIRHNLIAPASDLLENVFVAKLGLNAPPQKVYNIGLNGQSVYYSGRKYPVWEPSEHQSVSQSLTFYAKNWGEVERLIAIYSLNSTVLYRDPRRKIYGVLNNLQITDERRGYNISLAISQVDYNEEVEV